MPAPLTAAADDRRTGGTGGERGIVLFYALVGLMLVIGLVVTGIERNDSVRTLTAIELDVGTRARQAADSGLVDALAWLRRQYDQPVQTFAPRRDLTVEPAVDETDDADYGLVREFEIAQGYWGQYRVRRGTPAEPFVDADGNGIYDEGESFTDTDGDSKRSVARGCRDLSLERGSIQAGVTWYLESEGSVYKRDDPDLPLGEGRNVRLAHTALSTEVRRLSLLLPVTACIVVGTGSEISLEGAILDSDMLGLAYRPQTGKPKYKTMLGDTKRCEFHVPVEHAPVDGWESTRDKDYITCEDVFGVSLQTLRSMADYSVQLVSKLPKKAVGLDEYIAGQVVLEDVPVTIPEDALVVITPKDGKLVVDKGESIIGRGVIVIDGNLEVKPDTYTQFSGILFVTGEMKVEKAGAFEGLVVVGRKLEVKGELPAFKVKKSGRKKKSKKSWKSHKSKKSKKSLKIKPDLSVWFGHNPDLVSQLMQRIGNYRQYKARFRPPPVAPDGRPDETFRASVGSAQPGP